MRALAVVPVDLVHADLVSGAHDAHALVVVDLAAEAGEAGGTFAVKVLVVGVPVLVCDVTPAGGSVDALAAVLAGAVGARVVRIGAGRPHELGRALAGVAIDSIGACSS